MGLCFTQLYPVLQPLAKACLLHLRLTGLVSQFIDMLLAWQNAEICITEGCLRCKWFLSFSILSFVAPLDVGDELFESPVMNCCLVQMAHCCIYCHCPFNNTIRALATVTSSVLQPTLCMRVTAVSLCACISSAAAKFLTVFGLYFLAIMWTDVALPLWKDYSRGSTVACLMSRSWFSQYSQKTLKKHSSVISSETYSTIGTLHWSM